jgi:hypothetical protein
MHQVSDVTLRRMGRETASVTATLRSPELSQALRGTGLLFVFATWGSATVVLCWIAWHGGFGDTAHAFIRLCIASAAVLWVVYNGNRLWQNHNRATLYELVVICEPKSVCVQAPDGSYQVARRDQEIRFSSRPHRGGTQEERDERWVGHPIGYAYRDSWEVWCEAGLEVLPIVAVWSEEDARLIVRHLTEANLFATRGDDIQDFDPQRAEPV